MPVLTLVGVPLGPVPENPGIMRFVFYFFIVLLTVGAVGTYRPRLATSAATLGFHPAWLDRHGVAVPEIPAIVLPAQALCNASVTANGAGHIQYSSGNKTVVILRFHSVSNQMRVPSL